MNTPTTTPSKRKTYNRHLPVYSKSAYKCISTSPYSTAVSTVLSIPTRILSYSSTLSSNTVNSKNKCKRVLSINPERILDVPGYTDDYDTNSIDWSSRNVIAVGLEESVWSWNASNGNSYCIGSSSANVTSVGWSNDGMYVSSGTDTGRVELWDAQNTRLLRTISDTRTASDKVNVTKWSHHLIYSGVSNGMLLCNDVRIANSRVWTINAHTSTLCGLSLGKSGIATGGNDNTVHVWDIRKHTIPTYTNTTHTSNVKALCWCPWNTHILVSGSSHILIHNISTATTTSTINTSNTSTILFSCTFKEFIATTNTHIVLYGINGTVMATIPNAHEQRILSATRNNEYIATISADENLKVWKIWDGYVAKPISSDVKSTNLKMRIR